MILRTLIIFILFFIINPLFSIILLAVYGTNVESHLSSKGKSQCLVLFGIMCCIFVSLINMQIITAYTVDLDVYVYKYQIASKYDFFPYLLVGPDGVVDAYKEPLYHSVVWILNRLFNGAEKPFKFTISLLEYSLLISAVILFGKRMKMKMPIIMTGVVWMCFYPLFFTSTMNIVRQTLANSMLLFIMVRCFFYDKRDWIGIIAMLLVHASSAFFLPLLLMPQLGKPFKQSWYLLCGIVVVLLSYQILSQSLFDIGTFSADSSAGVALSRASEGAKGEFTYSTLSFCVVLGMLVLSICLYAGKLVSPTVGLRRLASVIIVLSVFVLMNSGEGQIAGRFAHYVDSFIPFLLMLFLGFKIRNNTIAIVLSFTIIILFTIYLHIGLWKFDVVAGGWFTPVFLYLF